MRWLNYVGPTNIIMGWWNHFFDVPPLSSTPTQTSCPMTEEHLQAARLCHKVYDDDYLHSSERFVDSEYTNVQCSMSFEDNKLFVVFRGSDDMVDWFHNFNMDLVKYPENSEAEFHAGFLVQWLSVKDEVKQKIAEMIELKAVDAIVFAGHSAGSPPACLCAKEVSNTCNTDVRVVTFGSPRFSNHVFKEDFEKSNKIPCTRIVLDRDLITRFPFSFSGVYAHVGKPLQLRDDHVLERETSAMETIYWWLLGMPRIDLGVRDHDVENYVSEIEKLVSKVGH